MTQPAPTDYMDLLGLGDVRDFDPDDRLAARGLPRDRLRVPIGVGDGRRGRSTSTSRSPPSRAWARTAW